MFTTPLRSWFIAVLVGTLVLTGCVSPERRTGDPVLIRAEASLKHGRAIHKTTASRAGFYLDAAADANSILESPNKLEIEKKLALGIYNAASGELAALLRDGGGGNLWKQGAQIPSPDGRTVYQLHFQTTGQGLWNPDFFTDFELASKVRRKGVRTNVTEPGYGGTLVGVRKTGHERTPRQPFSYRVGTAAPVTATLGFAKQTGPVRKVSLALSDPVKRSTAPLPGEKRPLAADFTAPFAWYPRTSEFWAGLSAMLKVEEYIGSTGLYMLAPYDPEKIPVIFVHGLASTPQMWINTINEVDSDPELRGRFQYWVYRYPTGTPTAYSAFRLRADLAALEKMYGLPKGCVLIGHSMGGLLIQMQSINTGRTIWDAVLRKRADEFYTKLPMDSPIKASMVFDANPQISRLVFICVPHRGSEMVTSRLGEIATRLISLPITMVDGVQSALGSSIDILTGGKSASTLTSIQSLSPKNPVLLSMDTIKIEVPYNSIIGDRGRNDTPNSSDGIVPYWSSHMKGAESELIVPGPHGSYQLPETIAELRRILHLELRGTSRKRRPAGKQVIPVSPAAPLANTVGAP